MPISVTILGNSSAKPTAKGHPSAQVVNINEQLFLVDAGEGVQRQMARCGISPLKLRAVFLSHLHGDHLYGLFPLPTKVFSHIGHTNVCSFSHCAFSTSVVEQMRSFTRLFIRKLVLEILFCYVKIYTIIRKGCDSLGILFIPRYLHNFCCNLKPIKPTKYVCWQQKVILLIMEKSPKNISRRNFV